MKKTMVGLGLLVAVLIPVRGTTSTAHPRFAPDAVSLPAACATLDDLRSPFSEIKDPFASTGFVGDLKNPFLELMDPFAGSIAQRAVSAHRATRSSDLRNPFAGGRLDDLRNPFWR